MLAPSILAVPATQPAGQVLLESGAQGQSSCSSAGSRETSWITLVKGCHSCSLLKREVGTDFQEFPSPCRTQISTAGLLPRTQPSETRGCSGSACGWLVIVLQSLPLECVPASGKGVGDSRALEAWPGLAMGWWGMPRRSGLSCWDVVPFRDTRLELPKTPSFFLGTAHSCTLCSQNILCNVSPEE